MCGPQTTSLIEKPMKKRPRKAFERNSNYCNLDVECKASHYANMREFPHMNEHCAII